jgi:Mu-like prophage I protein
MSQRMSYLVDLSQVSLSEGETPSSWIHAMTVGTYDHPVYGEIAFTEDRLQRFASSVVSKVRDIEPDIDYDHKAHNGDAAGWVKNAEVRADGLYLFVEWTKTAAEKIKSKAYKYFSPEFLDEWTHPKSATKFQDVLSGGAITNRPFLKDLSPLNLSEFIIEPGKVADPEERNDMDPKKFAELLGLPETATEEQILAKTKELKEKAEKPAVLSDADAELKKLSETNPAIKLLMESQQKLAEENARNSAALRLSEVRGSVTQLGEELRVKDVALPASTIESLTKVLHESNPDIGKAVLEIVKGLGETGFVELGEKGKQRTNNSADPIKFFTEQIVKVQTEHKLSYADAVQKLALEQPDAYREYAHNSYAVSGGNN